jgi:hypothetical protein
MIIRCDRGFVGLLRAHSVRIPAHLPKGISDTEGRICITYLPKAWSVPRLISVVLFASVLLVTDSDFAQCPLLSPPNDICCPHIWR